MNDHARLANMRLLLVEDDLLLGEIVGELLEAQNYDVTRCITVRAALASIHEEPPQLAVLDINIQDEAVFPVADALADAGIPFLFASAAHGFSIPDRHSQRDLIQKPFLLGDLLLQLKRLGAANR